jgi:prolyl-tRNA editing enzyme YbaK/EbsC (Cys-tRNA(Pro) deacylase)
MTLSLSAQKIQQTLTQINNQFKVIELTESARTAQDAAQAMNCEVAQIVKSLVFVEKITGKPILVLASGINRVNEKIIERELGVKITKADANFVREVTGFAIGGIPPVGHAQKLETYIDEDLFKWEELWAAAGTPHAVFKFNSNDLLAFTKGKVLKIT